MAEPSAVTAGALRQTWARLRSSLARQLGVVGSLCLGIATLLTAIDGKDFGAYLLYSLCIGFVCLAIVNTTALAMAWVSDRMRRAQGLPLQADVNMLRASIPGSLLAMILGPALGLTLAQTISGHPPVNLLNWSSPMIRMTLVLAVLGTVISMVIITALERLNSARAQAEAAQRLAAESQLRLLQSQLEPHMLFNTLANLRVLIGLQPAQAQAMLDHLIAYLRATLNASRSPLHPLATEFDRVADYLALMSVRMGPRLQVQLDLPEALRHCLVPPLLLQPLVENAVKHGLEPQVAGGLVQVQALQQGAALHLVVRDTGQGLHRAAQASAGGSHFGLDQVRQRLATLYGAAAHLSLRDAGDVDGDAAPGAVATLVMPMPTAPTTTAAPAAPAAQEAADTAPAATHLKSP